MKIGIDFGTSFSLPAALINGNPATLLHSGQYGLPSVFYYDKGQGVLIGIPAEDQGDRHAENVVRNIKMEISNPNKKSFTLDGNTYYAFYSRSYGFEQMDVYFIIDANGAIVKMDADTFIFEEEYFNGFQGIPDNYVSGFAGLTGKTWTDDVAVIAGATKTSNAMKQSTNDVFAAFESINKGGNN